MDWACRRHLDHRRDLPYVLRGYDDKVDIGYHRHRWYPCRTRDVDGLAWQPETEDPFPDVPSSFPPSRAHSSSNANFFKLFSC